MIHRAALLLLLSTVAFADYLREPVIDAHYTADTFDGIQDDSLERKRRNGGNGGNDGGKRRNGGNNGGKSRRGGRRRRGGNKNEGYLISKDHSSSCEGTWGKGHGMKCTGEMKYCSNSTETEVLVETVSNGLHEHVYQDAMPDANAIFSDEQIDELMDMDAWLMDIEDEEDMEDESGDMEDGSSDDESSDVEKKKKRRKGKKRYNKKEITMSGSMSVTWTCDATYKAVNGGHSKDVECSYEFNKSPVTTGPTAADIVQILKE